MSAEGWFAVERGGGRPLVLLHGIGMSSRAWEPVFDLLAAERLTIAFDLPGFGRTAPFPPGSAATPAAMAAALPGALAALGIDSPVDLAGSSLGAFVALEAAKSGEARSVVAISPAGLYRDRLPAWSRRILAANSAPRPLGGVTRALLRTRPGRTVLLNIPMAARGWRVPRDAALATFDDVAGATGYEATLDGLAQPLEGADQIQCPVTATFGSRDRLFLKRNARVRERLPAQTRWVDLPGCGHIPMWDDPAAVARLILDGTA